MFKKAFTLAEVLITLMIIGIVAALTIPSVISNYQQQEFKTGLKKAVSVLNEAIQTNIAIDGETPYESSHVLSYLKKHMSVLREDSDYVHNWNNQVLYTTDGMRYEAVCNINSNKFILHESGISLGLSHINTSECSSRSGNDCHGWGCSMHWCGSYGLANNQNNTQNPPCLVIVDVNGDKKPNPDTSVKWTKSEQEVYPGGPKETVWESDREVKPYFYPAPSDKKLTDVFPIMITDEKAIPFGVVAQRAMYSK